MKFTVAVAHKIDVVGKSKLHVGLPSVEMDVWWSWCVSCMVFSRNKWSIVGESKHP